MTGARPAHVRRLLVALVLLVGAVGMSIPAAPPAAADSATAVVVVDTGASVITRTISFSGSISGIDALKLAGANPQLKDYGGPLGLAVCKLFGVGDEFDQCPGGWNYYRSPGGAAAWGFSARGASNTTVHDGDVEGWKYGSGRPGGSPDFCDYVACAPPPTVAPAPAPTAPTASPGDTGGTAATPGRGSTTSGGTLGAATTGDGATSADGSAATAGPSTPTETSTPATSETKRKDTDEVALASSSGKAGTSGGSSSPIGLAVVAALLMIAATIAVVARRRANRVPPAGSS